MEFVLEQDLNCFT